MKFIKFKPIYFNRIWGGSKLKEMFNRNVPNNANIGESWEITDRPEAISIATNGQFANISLADIIANNQQYIMGKQWNKPFPILVKWIDANQPLSIQVHPNTNTAKILNAESKNENWFIVQSQENSTIIAGFKPSVKSASTENLTDGKWLRENLNEISTKKGDSIFITGGCVHAIGKGNLILEIQENSDTTYRLYDWDRLDDNGNPRKLHIDQSAKCINFSSPISVIETNQNCPIKQNATLENASILCNFELFEIRHLKMSKNATIELPNGEAKIISLVQGTLIDDENNSIFCSENVLQPSAETLKLTALEDSEVLITKIKI